MGFLKFIGWLVVFVPIVSFAQKGTVRGSVIDGATGDALIGVTVVVEGSTDGTASDIDGKFELSLEPGSYTLGISFISYQKVTVQDVLIKPNEVTLLNTVSLLEEASQLAEVVVTADVLRTTEEALLTVKRKSVNLVDGISAVTFRRTGDSDAAAAAKRVTGVSIEGGKYVYVRGLGDRYTKSTLNGVDIPGLDPDRNTLQLDIFPTNIVDNILVKKTFTAELPADFTGGIVDIQTKEFPDQKVLNVSLGLTYNPTMHLNSNYLTYNGGKRDYLGFDDGTRAMPTDRRTDLPLFAQVVGDPYGPQGLEYQSILQSFTPTMGAYRQKSFMDYNFGTSFGNQVTLGNNTLGYSFSLSYRNSTEYYEGAEYGNYGLLADPSVKEMEVRELQYGDFGSNNVLIGGLAGFALKRANSKYKLNALYLQNGESKAGIFEFENRQQGAIFDGFQHNLEYSERSIANIQLSGTNYFKDNKWELDWRIAPTKSTITDPDVRFTRYEYGSSGLRISTEAGFPQRIWRYLDETNLVGAVDISNNATFRGEPAKLRFGFGNTYKERDYEIQIFDFNVRNLNGQLTGNPDEIFYDENLWPSEGDVNKGTTYEPQFIPTNPNLYNANISNANAYVSYEFKPVSKLKAILGIRAEKYVQRYTGQDQQGTNVLDNDVVLDMLDFFPTANLIYGFRDDQNFRISYAKTIARPSFKEMSYAEIFDPLTNRTFVGGMFRDANDVAGIVYWDGNLRETDINNFDLRWETFQPKGQTFSLSAFYKTFRDPIEIVQYATQPGAFQPRNVGDGTVLGGEVEFRKSLMFFGPSFENFLISSNVTFTRSTIKMSSTEYISRVENARDGQDVKDTRPMAGQAPYIINVGLTYDGKANGIDVGLYYNVQGQTLQYVGIADRPDVYSVPFHSLNFSASKLFGKEEALRVSLRASNLLGDKRESVFQSFEATDQYFSRLNPGREIGLSVSYNF